METPEVLSVSLLTSFMKQSLESTFDDVWVSGEVSNVTRHGSGHIYLTLKDENAQLRCAIWRTTAEWLKFEIQNGMEVICRGNIDLYPPRGSYQLVIRSVQPQGIGQLQIAFQQMFERLKAEGLFDDQHKKKLPEFPRRIGFVTSPTGAAVRDFLQIGIRRWPDLNLTIFPCRVQGDGAAEEIARSIRMANRMSPALDVLIVGRGGGSAEDLWCFNEEPVVKAIFESTVPVVSAVGHEVDISLADLVADRRALTPSEAAEIVVPQKRILQDAVRLLGRKLNDSLVRQSERASERLASIAARNVLKRPLEFVFRQSRRVDEIQARLGYWSRLFLQQYENRIATAAARLEAVSPLSVLSRGYSVTTDADGNVVASVAGLMPGDEIRNRLIDGTATSQVVSVEKRNET